MQLTANRIMLVLFVLMVAMMALTGTAAGCPPDPPGGACMM
jgi:hypothetical protein